MAKTTTTRKLGTDPEVDVNESRKAKGHRKTGEGGRPSGKQKPSGERASKSGR
jgi:hypothetical protein